MTKKNLGKLFRSRRQGIRWIALVFSLLVCLQGLLLGEKLTLNRALEIAFKNSPSIQEAVLNLEISEHNLKAQQAGLKSQFHLTITPIDYSNQRTFSDLTSRYNTQERLKSEALFSISQPIKWTDGTLTVFNRFNWQEASSSFTGSIKEANYSNSLYLRYNQPLFTYNRTTLKIKELELSLENAQINHAIQKLQIERQVTQQFFNLYYSRESVKIAEEELANSTESFQIIESKVKAGISAPEELYQADLTRTNSQASLQNKQMQHENSLDSFKILLGLPLDSKLEIVADIRKLLVEVNPAKAIEHGLEHRMELRQRDIAIQNALNDLIRADAENEFKASLDVTFGLTGTNTAFNDVYKSPNTDRAVAVSLNIPLFDWGKKKHHMAASQAQIESRRLSGREERKKIKSEILQAFRSLMNQKTQIDIAEKNIINAELTYEINLERYKNGDLSSKDMQFYQIQLSEQRLKGVESLINYKVALLDLKIRTLWDFERNESLIDKN